MWGLGMAGDIFSLNKKKMKEHDLSLIAVSNRMDVDHLIVEGEANRVHPTSHFRNRAKFVFALEKIESYQFSSY